jgi:hypothetical protein
MGLALFLLVPLSIIGLLYYVYRVQSSEETKMAAMSSEERTKYQSERSAAWRDMEASHQNRAAESEYGPLSPQFICPHCHVRGGVRTKPIKQKAGVSGGKVTAALWTGGLSTLATGLSRKEELTKAHCGNCNSTWDF